MLKDHFSGFSTHKLDSRIFSRRIPWYRGSIFGQTFEIVLRANFFHSPFSPVFAVYLSFATQVKLFNHGGSCQLHVCELALYFAMEQTNLGDVCLPPKQTEILLNIWCGKDVTGL